MSLRLKLIGGLLLCFTVALITIFYGAISGQKISDEAENLRTGAFPALEEARALTEIVNRVKLNFQDALETSDQDYLDEAMLAQYEFSRLTQNIYVKTGDKEIIDLGKLFHDYVTISTIYVEAVIAGIPLNIMVDLGASELDRRINHFTDSKKKAFVNSLVLVESEAISFKQTFVVLGSFAIIVIGMILIVVFNIQKRLAGIVKHAVNLARGNLDKKIIAKRDDELGALENTFEGMRVALKTHIGALDELVEERTSELNFAKNQTQELLDNIDQGILVMNKNGIIGEQFSKKAIEIFEGSILDGQILPALLNASIEDANVFNVWLRTILKPQFQKVWKERGLDRLNPFNVVMLEKKGVNHYYNFDFELVFNSNDEVEFVMVLVNDITKIKQIEDAREEQEHQVSRLLAFIDNDMDSIRFFIGYCRELINKVSETSSEEILYNQENWMRELHTIRGNAGSYGLLALTKCAANIETHVVEYTKFGETKWLESVELFRQELNIIEKICQKITNTDDSRIQISKPRYQLVLDGIFRVPPEIEKIKAHILQLPYRELRSFHKKYNKILIDASDRFAKGEITLRLSPENYLLPNKFFQVLDGPLVHMLRNSVDHGIESPRERHELKKESPYIQLDISETNNEYVVSYFDDGRGLDPASLRQSSVVKGIYSSSEAKNMSDSEMLRVIFMHGFTSKNEVGCFSGRGVGMDVVHHAIEAVKGSIEINNTPKEGLEFIIHIPKSSILL
mgnify:CR=1 FL=1